ncbi:hypothetical protein [Streptomyces sp. NPDC060184]|uniref:hypothetical protein n=1 Tax=Streptomyces sp. NPDC060184 TaxID=3347064 RepID=UPI0036511C82
MSRTALSLSNLDDATLPQQTERLARLAGETEDRCREVVVEADTRNLPLSDPSRPYGVLVVEATRLMEEVWYTCDTLSGWVDA